MPAYVLAVSEDTYSLQVTESSVAWSVGEYVETRSSDLPEYAGPTDFTPSSAVQVVLTSGTAMTADITIQPVPSNYGLIEWDGSVLMVS